MAQHEEGYEEFLRNLMLIKGIEKKQCYDDVWKKICEELQWTFIPTV